MQSGPTDADGPAGGPDETASAEGRAGPSRPDVLPRAGGRRLGEVPAGWAFALLGVFLLLLGWLVWSPFPAGVWHDDGVYVLLGRALAEGEGFAYLGVSGTPPATKFPPLYPLTLAGLWTLFSGVGPTTTAAGVLNLVFLAAAGVLFARLLHRWLGATPFEAVAVTALAWLPVTLWRSALIPFSEPLFLLLLVVAVTAAVRAELRPDDGWAWVWFAVAVLLAVHARTAGVAVALAGAGALMVRGRRRAAGLGLGGVVVGMLPWTLWSASAGRRIPEPLRDVLGGYGGWLWEQLRSDPALYLGQLHEQARDLVARTLALLVPLPAGSPSWAPELRWLALAVLVPALFLGFDRIWSRSRTPVLLLFAYLGVVWLWPFRDDRLLAPIAPFLVWTVVEGFRWRGEGSRPDEPVPGTRGAPAGVAKAWRGTGIVWILLFAGVSLVSLADGRAAAGYDVRSRTLARVVGAVDEALPDDAVVGAPELWAGLHLYTGRTVAPSARFLPVRSDGPTGGTPREQHELWMAADLDHLVLEHGGRVHADAVDRVAEVCGDDALRRVASWEGGMLVRLAWSEACRSRLLDEGRDGAEG